MKKLLTAAVLFAGCGAFAQDADSTKKSNWTLTGSVDGYYRYNFNNAKDSGFLNNYTSFTNSHNSFELGMASLKVDHSIGKVSATLDLGVGRRAEEFSYNDQGARTAVKQAYLTYAPSDKVKFTMGKWATHVGYELVDAYLNRNYSMAYMFSYGPFFHTGLKADFTFDNIGFMAGVANPTDFLTASFNRKFFIGQVSAASESGKVKGYLNYVGGKYESDVTVNQFDLVATGTVSNQFSVGYNGTVQLVKPDGGESDSWWGSAVYLNYDPVSAFGLTLRGEYYDDKKGVSGLTAATGVATSVFAATLSGNIRIDNLTIIPEFRLDNAKDEIFFKKTGEGVKSTGSFILAATYHF
jgi:hypothetical protein